MILITYTPEEIRENQDSIVALELSSFQNGFRVRKPDIIKITANQFKTRTTTKNFSMMGVKGYGDTVYILEKDVEKVVAEYIRQITKRAETARARAVEELNKIAKFKKLED